MAVSAGIKFGTAISGRSHYILTCSKRKRILLLKRDVMHRVADDARVKLNPKVGNL